MPDDEKTRISIAFACQVLGIDGISTEPAPPDSVLGRMEAAKARCEAEGRSPEELQLALSEVLRTYRQYPR